MYLAPSALCKLTCIPAPCKLTCIPAQMCLLAVSAWSVAPAASHSYTYNCLQQLLLLPMPRCKRP